jgi:hypothetical protein
LSGIGSSKGIVDLLPPKEDKKAGNWDDWWRNLLIKWRPLRRILLKTLLRKSALKIAIIGIGKHLFFTIAVSVMISWIIHTQQGMIAYCANDVAKPSNSIPRQFMDRQISGQLLPRAILEPLANSKIPIIKEFGIKNIHSEDVRSYLLEDWESIYDVIKLCSGKNWPKADQQPFVELLTSMSSQSLSALFCVFKDKLKLSPKPEGEGEGLIIPALLLESDDKKEIQFILREISTTATNCTKNIASLVQDLLQVATGAGTQIQVPPIEAPLEDKADMLLTQFAKLEENSDMKLSSFFKWHHSGKIHQDSLSLAYLYGRLFEKLPSDPELLFPESEGIPESPERERPDQREPQAQTSAQSLLDFALRQTRLPRDIFMRQLHNLINEQANNNGDSSEGEDSDSGTN